MAFNTVSFFFFVTLVILLYRVLPHKYGKILLVFASYYFYGATIPWYCLLLFISTITDYFAGQWIFKAETKSRKNLFMGLSLFVNLGLLFVFKYYDFAASSANTVFHDWSIGGLPLIDVILPVGISFYTFQTLSYTIDIYRGEEKPCKDFWTFSLFVAYFPQLVAGPVERSGHLIPQLERKYNPGASEVMHGIERVLWGLIKKVVVADRLAVFVNQVYGNPEESSSLLILFAIIAFSMQLYLDFSGYCDVAIGVARIMGVRLTENFAWPMSAKNPAEFWNKWNITLTSWFRDYFYRSLGGLQRKNLPRSMMNLMFFFIAVGFWHGARWNFLYFGIFNGILVAIYQYWRIFKARSILKNKIALWVLSLIFTFVCIHISGFLFRIPDVGTAYKMLSALSSNTWFYYKSHIPYMALGLGAYLFVLLRGQFMPKVRAGVLKIPYYRPITNLLLLIILLYGAYSY
jgi:D-alanyl-lipoteichoic acid acyltransferase DltB (MBOAT superfamily)